MISRSFDSFCKFFHCLTREPVQRNFVAFFIKVSFFFAIFMIFMIFMIFSFLPNKHTASDE